MTLFITGSSSFVGTNFKKENLGYRIQDIDLLKIKPEEISFYGCEALLHLAALVYQMKGARPAGSFPIELLEEVPPSQNVPCQV